MINDWWKNLNYVSKTWFKAMLLSIAFSVVIALGLLILSPNSQNLDFLIGVLIAGVLGVIICSGAFIYCRKVDIQKKGSKLQ